MTEVPTWAHEALTARASYDEAEAEAPRVAVVLSLLLARP
jgi:hypothetical protein